VANLNESVKRPKIVGNFIRQRREALNLSQRALGLLFDPPVTTQFISNVERGVTPLPPAHVPTLTRALQVSEAEIMGLLEKEYTMKLSGRLGLVAQEQDGMLAEAGAIVIPMNALSPSGFGHSNNHLSVSSHDLEFMRKLYDAYKAADSQTRQNFASLCETVLNVQRNLPLAAASALAAASGERPQS
jgi:transcriptional regulator with XRE-family HTH domain